MRIKICGFKCHLDIELTFLNNQMTLIKGHSGVGKSTILQAIYFALYGNMRSIYNNAGITKNLSVTLELPNIHIFRKKNPELLVVTLSEDKTDESSGSECFQEAVYEPESSGSDCFQEAVYEDAIAQSVIDNKFGSKEVWRACSYIEQQSRCSLLSGSGSERMELLNALSFTGETPKEYISKISEVLKEKNLEFTAIQASFITELELYKSDISEGFCPSGTKNNTSVKEVVKNLSLEDMVKLDNKIVSLTEQEKNCYQEVCEFERYLGSYNYLKSQTQILEERIALYKPDENVEMIEKVKEDNNVIISFSDYSSIKNRLEKLLNQILISQEEKQKLEKQLSNINLNSLQEKIINIPNIQDLINTPIDSGEIWRVANLEKERENALKECKELNLNISQIPETLKELSEKLNKYTHLEKHLNDYKRLISLEQEIRKIENGGNLEELETLSKEKSLLIADLRKGLELLSCPSCNIPLRYRNNQLTVGERNPVSKEEISEAEHDLRKIENLLKETRKYLSLKENLNSLSHILEIRKELEDYLVENSSIRELSNLINRISNIKVEEAPKFSSETLKDIAAFQNAYHLSNDLEQKIEQIVTEDDCNVRKELKELEEKYRLEQERVSKNQKLLREYHSKMDELKKKEMEKMKHQNDVKELERLKEEILKIKLDWNVKDNYEKLKKELEFEKLNLEQAKFGNKMVERGKVLSEKREDVVKLQKDVEALTRLKLKAVEVECKQLEDTVNNINTILETTLPIFFNEPISMRLLLYKQVKKNIKPCLNLEICYKGCKYDNVSNLSGGEGDRISLGLLLALNAVSNSPILLLDECVSSLDEDLKESCITAIKSIPNKTVIVVDHDSSLEGFYDDVVKM